ncbi:hypothetical protein QE419_002647 [Brevundimonas vesicularis]|nr:hypothetical protein [Brevundimonas vesicularis]
MRYYVNTNAQSNGDNEVHTSSCNYLPGEINRRYLGDFTSCVPAVAEARRYYRRANGCFWCSRACHTS